jgi:hypothetical protein
VGGKIWFLELLVEVMLVLVYGGEETNPNLLIEQVHIDQIDHT